MVYRSYGKDQKLLSENAEFQRTWAELVVRSAKIDDVIAMARHRLDEYGEAARRKIWIAVLMSEPSKKWEHFRREIFLGEWKDRTKKAA